MSQDVNGGWFKGSLCVCVYTQTETISLTNGKLMLRAKGGALHAYIPGIMALAPCSRGASLPRVL